MRTFRSPVIGTIELTDERRLHIVAAHPETKTHIKKFSQILQQPDVLRRSRFDKNVLLFYIFFANIRGGKYINVTVKTGRRNFILTAYFTDKIKAGEPYETEKKSS